MTAIIVRDIEQSTPEWHALRSGIPTASCFDKIVTPAKLEASKSAGDYLMQLLAEWLSGQHTETYTSGWMARGVECEAEARDFYSFAETEVEQVGFVYSDDRRIMGCSPDGLIGDDGVLEIKCPAPKTHLGYLLNGGLDADYRMQIYGSLLVTGRKFCDIMSYCSGLPEVIVKVQRDAAVLTAMTLHLEAFIAKMLTAREDLIARGYSPK